MICTVFAAHISLHLHIRRRPSPTTQNSNCLSRNWAVIRRRFFYIFKRFYERIFRVTRETLHSTATQKCQRYFLFRCSLTGGLIELHLLLLALVFVFVLLFLFLFLFLLLFFLFLLFFQGWYFTSEVFWLATILLIGTAGFKWLSGFSFLFLPADRMESEEGSRIKYKKKI